MAISKQKNAFDRDIYWDKRKHLNYYSVVEKYTRYVGRDAQSLIDVGGTSSFVEWFDWIPDLWALDINHPYESDRVKGITADFLTYEPGRKFDLLLCLQVLEHLNDPRAACDKMKDIAGDAIVSVPYKWNPEITAKGGHIQDPVDLEKVNGWMGQEPVDSLVVNEPFRPNWPRLVAWYSFSKSPVQVNLADYRASQKPIA